MSHQLLNVALFCPQIQLELVYASAANFLGFAAYSEAICYLHKDALRALDRVQKQCLSLNLSLKVYDGYRPFSVQQLMWEALPDERYVSNPAVEKGRHTRGTAVDVTLVDSSSQELLMPSAFDDFSLRASSDYPHPNPVACANRALLKRVMEQEGFIQSSSEWWHFDLQGWQDDLRYPPLDLSFAELGKNPHLDYNPTS